MGIKNKMADFIMGKMTSEEKGVMMDQMMNKFFEGMKPEEKQKIMEDMMGKFMGTMTGEEKQTMMQTMLPNIMGSMMGGGTGSPMMNMMSMIMGGKGPMGMMKSAKGNGDSSEGQMEMPWDMCKKMMSSISKTSELATFATPEVRQLFEEWAVQIEDEILSYVQETKINEIEKIAEHFKLSRESVTYFLTRLANKGKINLKAQKVD
ncbi:MAG: hypothetical protein ABR936_12270 [Bacteroidota bacterium]|jgi:hypothetical protein